jgi:hypothetical protein
MPLNQRYGRRRQREGVRLKLWLLMTPTHMLSLINQHTNPLGPTGRDLIQSQTSSDSPDMTLPPFRHRTRVVLPSKGRSLRKRKLLEQFADPYNSLLNCILSRSHVETFAETAISVCCGRQAAVKRPVRDLKVIQLSDIDTRQKIN